MPHRWNEAAELRRIQIESGADLTFCEVFKPRFIEWIRSLGPNKVIEVGAGTGHLSLAIVEYGYSLTAIEPSKGMFNVAQQVLENKAVDLKNCSSFELAINDSFDMAFSHMVAQVVEDLNGFLDSVYVHLAKGGRFIFSIPHPCFYNSYKGFFGSEYNYMKRSTKNVSFSITKDPDNVISEIPYHHRPISDYINSIVDAGFALERFEEIYPQETIQKKYGRVWENPRYCAFFCRKF